MTAEEEAGRAAAVSESVRHVERWIEKQHSPISGICGISDGGLIAAAVAARSPSLLFFINFCSRQWELLPTGMDLKVPQSITTPSLHVLGRADTMLGPAQLWSVPSRCENMSTLWHKGGHVVPLLDGAVAAALRRFLGVGSATLRTVQAPAGASDSEPAPDDGRLDSNSLITLVGAAAQMTGRSLTADIPLFEAGLDSLALVDLVALLSEQYPTAGEIPQTIAFEYPTLRAIDSYLLAASADSGAAPRSQPFEELALEVDIPVAMHSLPMPLYLALEAGLMVTLQLADALPLCAALLGASFMAHHTSAFVGVILLPFCLVLAALLNMLATVALKWAVLGRVRPGAYPLHGWWHLRYWFVESRLHCHDFLLRHFLVGTSLYNTWLRLLGARVGARASVNTLSIGAALDLPTIGAAANVGDCSISCHYVPQSGVMVVAPVVVGARAILGPQSIVMPGASVGEGTVVGANCCVPVARTLPSHTFWAGQPLQQVPADPLEGVTFVKFEQNSGAPNCIVDPPTVLTEVLPRRGIDTAGRLMALRPLLSLLMATWCGTTSVGGLVFGALVYFPRAWLTAVGWDSWGVALILLASFAWVWQPVMLLLGVLLKWLLVGRRRPGVHASRYPKVACSTYHSILSDLTGSKPFILTPPSISSLYLRVCGAVIGRRVLVHNPLHHVSQADLLRLGNGSFVNRSTKLNLQLPVASEATLNVQSSIFDLGKARR